MGFDKLTFQQYQCGLLSLKIDLIYVNDNAPDSRIINYFGVIKVSVPVLEPLSVMVLLPSEFNVSSVLL